jgi:hypothetical protein
MAGIRSWIVATSSLAGVVRIAKVRTHSPFGFFQFSQMPAMPLVCRVNLIHSRPHPLNTKPLMRHVGSCEGDGSVVRRFGPNDG